MNTANPIPTNPIQQLFYSLAKGVSNIFDPAPRAGTPTASDADPTTWIVTGSLGFPTGGGLTFSATQPSWGTVALGEDGSYIYTPTEAAREAGVSTDMFIATVHNGLSTSAVTVTVPVGPAAPIPTGGPRWGSPSYTIDDTDPATGVVSGHLRATADHPYQLDFIAVDGPDPAVGHLGLWSTGYGGDWIFTPTSEARVAAFYGDGPRSVTFTIKATDGTIDADPVSITVPIVPSAARTLITVPDGARLGNVFVGPNGTVYSKVYRETNAEGNKFESWLVGVLADGTVVETDHVAGQGFLGVGDYGGYASINDPDAQQIHVIGIDAAGTPVNYLLPVYADTGWLAPVVNRFGVYQMMAKAMSDGTDQTMVVTVAGQGVPVTVFPDSFTGYWGYGDIESTDHGVYATVWHSSTSTSTVATIAGEGPAMMTVAGRGDSGGVEDRAGVVGGPRGVYWTVGDNDGGGPITVVYRLVGEGPERTVIAGYPDGRVVIGPDGVYQTAHVRYITGDAFTRVATISGDGAALTEVDGYSDGGQFDPEGVIVSDYGIYQAVYDQAEDVTHIVRIAGNGPASTQVAGSVTLVATKLGISAIRIVWNSDEETSTVVVSTIAGRGNEFETTVAGSTASNSTVAANGDHGTFLTFMDRQNTVLTIAGDGPVVRTLGNGSYSGTYNGPAGVYEMIADYSSRATTIWKLAGSGPESVVVPDTSQFPTIAFAPDGTGYYVATGVGVYFGDTTRSG
jgi:hypothetical protein